MSRPNPLKHLAKVFGVFVFLFGLSFQSQAMDAKDKAVAGQALGGAMFAYAAGDAILSSINCNPTTSASCTNAPQTCCTSLMPNVMTMLGAAGMILSAIDTEEAVDGNGGGGGGGNGGGGGGGGNPGSRDPFGEDPCANDPRCSCNGPNAAINPFCSADKPKAIRDFAKSVKDGFNNGTFPLPDGLSIDDLNKQFDDALGGFDTAVGIADGTIDPSALEGSGFGNFSKDGKGSGSRSKGGFGDDSIDGASGGGGAGGIGSTVGPKDRSGLGKTVWNGLLDMLDDATGKSLSLWQRATRRYQGEKGQRALLMARMEMIRNRGRKLAMEREKALKSKAVVKAEKKKNLTAKTKKPTPKNAPKKVPASTRPTSLN